jgi:HSP20 family protein
MVSLRDAMNRLIEDSFLRPFGSMGVTGEMIPEIDVYETNDEIVVEASLPGIKPEDVDISVTGDVLTLKGEIKSKAEKRQGRQVVQERRWGNFVRTIILPTEVNVDKAQAEFENGVLNLHLPKTEGARPRTIQIKKK